MVTAPERAVGARGEDAGVGALPLYRIVHVVRERDRDEVGRAVANHGVAAVLDIHTRGREYVCEVRKDAQGPSRAVCVEGKPSLRAFVLNYMEMSMAEGLECIADRELLMEIMNVRCDASPLSPGDPTGSDQGLGGSTKALSVRVAPPRDKGASQRQRGDEGARGRRKCTSSDGKATLETARSVGELKLQQCDEESMKMVRMCFIMPINEACAALECCSSFLKKICRRNGVARWPYRKLMSIERVKATISHSMERNQSCPDGYVKSLVGLQLASEMNFLERERCALLGLDPGEDQAHNSLSHND